MLKNIYSPTSETGDEILEELLATDAVRIERIVSTGQSTPPGEWYDQENDEWVVLLSGRAQLLFENDGRTVEMCPGDYVHIPAHIRHRVEWTDPDERSIWLAIHFRSP